jgi:hypothetical protein
MARKIRISAYRLNFEAKVISDYKQNSGRV